MHKNRIEIPGHEFTLEDFPFGYANNTRGMVPVLKFWYGLLEKLPLIQFVSGGSRFDTIFHKIEYQFREKCGYLWDNCIRQIYYYDGAKISNPISIFFSDPKLPHYKGIFEICIWDLMGMKQIYSKSIQLPKDAEWYEFKCPKDIVDEIGETIKIYHNKIKNLC